MLAKVSDYKPAFDPPDEYDLAIQYLLGKFEESVDFFKEAVFFAWSSPCATLGQGRGGELFKVACRCQDEDRSSEEHLSHGCLTQIRGSKWIRSSIASFTEQIRLDSRIPTQPYLVTPDDLPVFAEWQRKLDKVAVLS